MYERRGNNQRKICHKATLFGVSMVDRTIQCSEFILKFETKNERK